MHRDIILLVLVLLIVLGYCFKSNSIISGGDIIDEHKSILSELSQMKQETEKHTIVVNDILQQISMGVANNDYWNSDIVSITEFLRLSGSIAMTLSNFNMTYNEDPDYFQLTKEQHDEYRKLRPQIENLRALLVQLKEKIDIRIKRENKI